MEILAPEAAPVDTLSLIGYFKGVIMLSNGPISSSPLSTSGSADLSGTELFLFTLVINKVLTFTLKLSS